jgi:mRNA degradation ribonuclease J1/J2
MTNNNENLEQIVTSLARSVQAIADDHEERIQTLEDIAARLDRNIANQQDSIARLIRIEEAQNRMLASIDEDRPTVLRKLDAIENKIDRLLEE